MDAIPWITGAAAGVGPGVALATFVRQIRKDRPVVTVELSRMRIGSPVADFAAHLTVRNHSDHRIHITAVGFKMVAGTMNTAVLCERVPGATLPGWVEPRDSGFTYIPDNTLSVLDHYQPMLAWAELATKERFSTKTSFRSCWRVVPPCGIDRLLGAG